MSIVFELEWNDTVITRVTLRATDLPPLTPPYKGGEVPPLCKGRLGGVEPTWVASVIHRLERHLSGTPQSFTDVPLNWKGIPPFHLKVYKALQKIPTGNTITYSELAKRAGSPGAARAVGQAMAKNPFPILVPCHRVTAADGTLGGFSGGRGVATKRQLLQREGVDRHALLTSDNN